VAEKVKAPFLWRLILIAWFRFNSYPCRLCCCNLG